VKKRDNKRLYIYFVKHKRTIAGCRGIMLSRNIKQKDKKDGKRYMGYLPAVCGFLPGIVQELPRRIQTPTVISRQT